jgi:hypothetical protein
MTDYLARKLQGCTYPGCTAEPLADNCQCERHRDEHRYRNRLWKMRRRVQLRFAYAA